MENTFLKLITFMTSIFTAWTNCINYDYVCKSNGLGIKYIDPNIPTVNSSDYKGCIDKCFQEPSCKVFEFDPIQQVCKFSSVYFENIQSVPSSVLLWKKTPNITCRDDLTEGGRNHSKKARSDA